jgi:hypothetical protein
MLRTPGRAVGVTIVALVFGIAPLFGANDNKQEKGAVRFRVTIPEQALRITSSSIPVEQGSLKSRRSSLRATRPRSPPPSKASPIFHTSTASLLSPRERW